MYFKEGQCLSDVFSLVFVSNYLYMNQKTPGSISDCENLRVVKQDIPLPRTAVMEYAILFKVRILGGVATSALLGLFVVNAEVPSALLVILLLIGTSLSYAGASAWNQVLEVPYDQQMLRTKDRPLPSGKFSRGYAASLGALLGAFGSGILYLFVHPLTGWLSVLAFLSYVFIYTPLKRTGWYGTLVGTVPGAIPAVGGAVASGEASLSITSVLFFLMVFWQLPHFYSYLWGVREEYEVAGFKMLPYAASHGHLLMNTLIMVGAVLTLFCTAVISYISPALGGFSGIAASLGATFLVYQSFCFISAPSHRTSKGLFKSSIYFIAYFTCIAVFSVF